MIIFFNGCSDSGKSTTIDHLSKLVSPAVCIGIDSCPNHRYHKLAKDIGYLSKKGHNLLVDEIILEDCELVPYLKQLKNQTVYFIKVCSSREVKTQKLLPLEYDLYLNTDLNTPEKCAQDVLQLISTNLSPQAFKNIQIAYKRKKRMELMNIVYFVIGLNIIKRLVQVLYTGRYKESLTIAAGGGGGGGKSAPAVQMPVVQPAPTAPTSTDATTAAAVQASQQSRAAAAGLASTDITQGALAGNPGLLTSSNKPTLLGS